MIFLPCLHVKWFNTELLPVWHVILMGLIQSIFFYRYLFGSLAQHLHFCCCSDLGDNLGPQHVLACPLTPRCFRKYWDSSVISTAWCYCSTASLISRLTLLCVFLLLVHAAAAPFIHTGCKCRSPVHLRSRRITCFFLKQFLPRLFSNFFSFSRLSFPFPSPMFLSRCSPFLSFSLICSQRLSCSFLSRVLRCTWRSAARHWLEDYARYGQIPPLAPFLIWLFSFILTFSINCYCSFH